METQCGTQVTRRQYDSRQHEVMDFHQHYEQIAVYHLWKWSQGVFYGKFQVATRQKQLQGASASFQWIVLGAFMAISYTLVQVLRHF